ncbi:MAG: beta-ketoacyl-ACP synthase II [Bacteroidales bacterium]|nr:beta-ketoacyl-ACP synthase II [Bacteroidales bacterium]
MRVVVTGMGIISPIGNDIRTYWKNLVGGVCGITKIEDPLYDELPSKVWGLVKDFNPDEFGIEPAMARKQDKFALYAIAAAKQAVDQSGIVSGGNVDPSRFGVYFGSGIGGFETIRRDSVKMENDGPKWVSPHFVPTMIPNIAAGYIAIRNNAQGPCFSISTACATGTHCIGEAYRAIKHGYADVIITGGAEAPCVPMSVAAFGNMKALTKETDPLRASLPFNVDRGGFVLAEGAGALVLESYNHAVKRGATILAEVCGFGSTCDAYHVTAPRPDGSTQAAAVKAALKEAGYCGRRDVLHINSHGTGTPLNDSSETNAFHIALGRNAGKAIINSTKSMTGHMLGAAGAAEAIAAILALKEGVVPPTIGLDRQDPVCDLNYTPLKAVKAPLTIAVSDSLGFGGHNSCVAFRKVE